MLEPCLQVIYLPLDFQFVISVSTISYLTPVFYILLFFVFGFTFFHLILDGDGDLEEDDDEGDQEEEQGGGQEEEEEDLEAIPTDEEEEEGGEDNGDEDEEGGDEEGDE